MSRCGRRIVELNGLAAVAVAAVSLLGGCMYVPAITEPAAPGPNAPQKTITELLAQANQLAEDAMKATGDTTGWMRGHNPAKPWNPTEEDVSLDPCSMVGSKRAHRVQFVVYHPSFDPDPHPLADKLTAHWKAQGFRVERTIDWTAPDGDTAVELGATRSDGPEYGVTITNELVSIDVATVCSADSSIDRWVEARLQQRFNSLKPSPSTPSPSPQDTDSLPGDQGGFYGF